LNKAFSANKSIFTAPKTDTGERKEVWDYDKEGNLVKVGDVPKGAQVMSKSSKDPNQWDVGNLQRRRETLKKEMLEFEDDTDPRAVKTKQMIDYIDGVLDSPFDEKMKTPKEEKLGATGIKTPDDSLGMNLAPKGMAGAGQPQFGKTPAAMADDTDPIVAYKWGKKSGRKVAITKSGKQFYA
jgi:hypothetical protein